MSEEKITEAILVGIASRNSELDECERGLDELERLVHTAGARVYAKVVQIKESYDPRTLIGKGKVSEISEIASTGGVELVIFDEELSPAQIRNLENDIGDVTVLDRSMLILDIFALHATSGEGKLQVELAQLKYTAPRLVGHIGHCKALIIDFGTAKKYGGRCNLRMDDTPCWAFLLRCLS